jgi:O-antigen/teichoic acid export membrane protein
MQLFKNKEVLIFIKNYFWQSLSLLVRLLSMFWVIPYLTSDKTSFGIYSLVTSFSLFLGYADLGFFKAASQFGSQSQIKNNEDEYKILGLACFFSGFIYLSFAILFFYFSHNPKILFAANSNFGYKTIEFTSNLFLILALSVPIQFLQKIVSIIFEVRLKGYIVYRISSITSFVPLILLNFFVSNGNFLIVNYFAFIQIMSLLSLLICIFFVKSRIQFSFKTLIYSVRFHKEFFTKMKSVAFSGFYIYLMWFLWQELDRVFIGSFFGLEALSSYMIVNTIFLFLISINTIIFQPIITKANYIYIEGGSHSLKIFLSKVNQVFFPFILTYIVMILVLIKDFLSLWVGNKYLDTVLSIQWMVGTFFLISFSQQINLFFTITGKLKIINLFSSIQALIYWLFFFIAYKYFGIYELILFKALIIILGHLYWLFLNKNLDIISFNLKEFMKTVLWVLVPLFFILYIFIFFDNLFSINNLYYFVFYYSIPPLLSFFIYFLSNKEYKKFIKSFLF